MAKKIQVLMVEDDPGDVDLAMEAPKESKTDVELHVVDDGEKALQYLRRQSPYENAVRPELVLLDLNLPKKDGRQVLLEIKKDEGLRLIPVVILTTSDSDAEVLRAYDGGANCYVTKPVALDQFIRVMESIEKFWFMLVRLPE